MEQLTLADVSKYLSLEIIDKVFKSKTNSEDNVESVEVSKAAGAGEGMISAVYQIKVTGKKHTTSLIVKGLVQNAILQNTLQSTTFFKREALFFSEVMPVLIETQKSLGAKENIQNDLPLCYDTYVDGKNDYIIMEDLSAKELKSLPKYITKYERDIVLKVLAHFHSVSLALRVQKPEVFSNLANALNEVYYNDGNRDWFATYLQQAIAIDKNVLAEIEGTNGVYYKKFEELLKDDVYGQLVTLTSTRGDHPTISHGDAWYPNFLCHKEHAVAIDFQFIRCASPVTDLSYFIILCSHLSASKEDFLEAVDVYYKRLEYYLKDMGIDANEVFSRNIFKEELKKYGKYGLLAAMTTLPLLASEQHDMMEYLNKLSDTEIVPLEELWRLTPMTAKEDKLRVVNAVRVAVDVGFI